MAFIFILGGQQSPFAGAGGLSATGNLRMRTVPATMAGAGSLTGNLPYKILGQVLFQGAGSFASNIERDHPPLHNFATKCRFYPVSGGIGDFVVDYATPGRLTPQEAFALDGKEYHYYAQDDDGNWEEGYGKYINGTETLERTRIVKTSAEDDELEPINFAVPPVVDVFPSPTYLEQITSLLADAGTRMVFYQAAAPAGWTKVVDHDDKSLRVVSGTGGGNGGSVAFSTLFGRTTVDSLALSTAQMPTHNHSYTRTHTAANAGATAEPMQGGSTYEVVPTTQNTGNQGSSSAHTHGMDMRVTYVDVIICEKDPL